MSKSYYHKNISKTSDLLWASKSCYIIWSFVLNNNSVEKNKYTKSSFLFFLKKASPKKQKKNHQLDLFDYHANKNEAINTLGFSSIWISL